ncbi:MAG: YhdP family protein [Halioglobus sp.]
MGHAFFNNLGRFLWKVIVAAVVILAVYVSFGRFLMSNVEAYREDILRELNSRSPFVIEAQDVSGRWHSFTPEIVLTGLQLSVPESDERPLELAEGRVTVNVWESLQTRSLRTYRLSLDQLLLRGELTSEGKLLIAGMGGGDGEFVEELEAFLLNIEQIQLTNNQLILDLPDLTQRLFDLDLTLRREGSARILDADLVSHTTGTEIILLGQGVGNPTATEAFTGELYINVVKSNLRALRPMLPKDLGARMTGAVAMQAWLAWDRGKHTVTAELTGQDLSIEKADESWNVPLDFVSIKASLNQRDDRWSLFTTDLEIHNEGVELLIPRLQIDGRGDSLRFRASEVPLAPLNAILLGLDPTPEALGKVFEVLSPEGELTSLQVNVADYGEPLKDWDLTGNFTAFEVKSWKGAPGLRADNGYVELESDGGFVIIDSQQFSMDFPTIYREALQFDDFYGTINLDWTDSEVSLSSGLVVAQGAEGTARALFDLSIPLVESAVGLEMDLLVGLENTHPIHRTKYLPYTLSEPLLKWLKDSIGEGDIEEGAFLWRGSLIKNASALRTVQLFFNIANTELDYYEGWPSLSDVDGTVLIDDSLVSVWSESARLYDSSIDFLSVEAWMSDQREMMLAISSAMSGDAGDGLQIVNESPISALVGDAFTQWSLSGDLDTQLDLLLNLSDKKTAPIVDVQTLWREVDLGINPGGLKIEGISGELAYTTLAGLRSVELAGSIWGEAVQAEVRQADVFKSEQDSEPQVYSASSSVTEVALQTQVDFEDVGRWLDLDLLNLATGKASASVLIEAPPGSRPRVILDSDLSGVGLDLPDPWRKTPLETRALHLELPLGGASQIMKVKLGSDLSVDMSLAGRSLEALSLGMQQAPAPLVSGVVRVAGRASYLDEQQWQQFLSNYVYPTFESDLDTDALGSPENQADDEVEAAFANESVEIAPLEQDSPQQSLALEVEVENFRADTLQLFGQSLQDVVFSLDKNRAGTTVTAETDWIAGKLFYAAGSSPARLDIDTLDLARLKELFLNEEEQVELQLDEVEGSDLPDVDVTLGRLSYAGKALGALQFSVRNSDNVITFENIVGDIAGLSATADNHASLVWDLREGGSATRFDAQLGFEDLGKTLEQLTYQSIIETNSGKMDLSLNWPGGPQAFSLAGVQGSLDLDIAEGRFLNTPVGTSGTLKVVGILNLANIVQRLSLDLSDVFSSGIPFHNIDGEVFFHGGEIEVARMEVEGRSSGFQFSGVSDVATRSLDGQLIATLPVANNLPWVAALAGGLPVAAGVFVVSKVFEKQMNRFSSAVYKIEGDWQDPQVNFDRVFDTSSNKTVVRPTDPNEETEDSLPELSELEQLQQLEQLEQVQQ